MAQKSIHPKLQKVKFVFSGGRTMEIPSTYKKSEFLCETDIFIHMAWKSSDNKEENFGSKKVTAFNANFGGISILNSLKQNNQTTEEEKVTEESTSEKPASSKTAKPKKDKK